MSLAKEIEQFANVYALIRNARKNNSSSSAKDKTSARVNAVYKRGQESSPAGAIPTAGARSQGQVTSAGNFGETDKLVMDQLTSRGVSPQVAAGAVGSMMGESGKGLNPAAEFPTM